MYNAPLTPSALERHHEKSSEVFIPVLQHGRLHLGSCRASVLKILIKIAISHGRIRAIKPGLLWKRTMKSRLKYLFLFWNMVGYTLAVVALQCSKF